MFELQKVSLVVLITVVCTEIALNFEDGTCLVDPSSLTLQNYLFLLMNIVSNYCHRSEDSGIVLVGTRKEEKRQM